MNINNSDSLLINGKNISLQSGYRWWSIVHIFSYKESVKHPFSMCSLFITQLRQKYIFLNLWNNNRCWLLVQGSCCRWQDRQATSIFLKISFGILLENNSFVASQEEHITGELIVVSLSTMSSTRKYDTRHLDFRCYLR